MYLRLALILVQRMSMLYGLVTIITSKSHFWLEVLGMAFLFGDATVRSYFLCVQGESLCREVSEFLKHIGISRIGRLGRMSRVDKKQNMRITSKIYQD